MSLIKTATSLDVRPFKLLLALLEVHRRFPNDQNLLVAEILVSKRVVQLDFDVVFDFGLGLFATMLLLEVKRGGQIWGQRKLEGQRIDTGG